MFVGSNTSIGLDADAYSPFASGSLNSVFSTSAAPVPAGCSFTSLYAVGTISGSPGEADTVTIKISKSSTLGGGVTDSTLSVTLVFNTGNTVGTTLTGNDTNGAHAFAVSAGDYIAYKVSQTNVNPTGPGINLRFSSRCQ
jgi:hypothetical protein